MKLKNVHTFNSVKCGAKEATFFQDDTYDLTLENNIITIINKKTLDEVCTSLANVPWFCKQPKQEITSDGEGSSSENTERTRKKTSKKT